MEQLVEGNLLNILPLSEARHASLVCRVCGAVPGFRFGQIFARDEDRVIGRSLGHQVRDGPAERGLRQVAAQIASGIRAVACGDVPVSLISAVVSLCEFLADICSSWIPMMLDNFFRLLWSEHCGGKQ